jgi:uncharacterized repeat protein (TIGR02543 family)
MNGNSVISSNISSSRNGGGVYVSIGTLTMNGNSVISSNFSSFGDGGGVYVSSGGLTMNDNSAISSNTALGSGSGGTHGGGVYVASGTLTMNGNSAISSNTASLSSGGTHGGGVYVASGTLTMNGNSAISGNTASGSGDWVGSGGGVYLSGSSIFYMMGGTIYGTGAIAKTPNTATTGASLYKDSGVQAWYGNGITPIIAGEQADALYTDDTLTGGITGPATYTVTFNSNGGTAVEAITGVSHDTKITTPAAPTKIGYFFDGWYKETSLANFWIFDTSTVISSITLYAKWIDPLAYAAKVELQTAIDNATIFTEGLYAAGDKFFGYAGTIPVGLLATDDTTALAIAQAALISTTTVQEVEAAIAALAAAKATAAIPGTKGLAARVAAAPAATAAPYPETTIYLYGDEGFVGVLADNITGKAIALEGVGIERTITLSSNGAMFYLGANGSLTLNDKVTLKGKSGNNRAVVYMNDATAALTMNSTSTISGNSNSNIMNISGGVYVDSGTLIMNGNSVISGNSSFQGSGVYVSTGTLTMNDDSTISGNSTISTYGGGGVFVSGGTLTMNGNSAISGNTSSGSDGGGVLIHLGTLIMAGGTIYGSDAAEGLKNTASTGDSLYKYADGRAWYGNGTDPIIAGDQTTDLSTDATLIGGPTAP